MARRRSGSGKSSPAPATEPRLNAPFEDLARRLRARPATSPPEASPPAAAPPRAAPEDDDTLFARAMEGVSQLPDDPHGRLEPRAPASGPARLVTEDDEALGALSDLVAGATDFDVTDTHEYVEGVVAGLDPRIARRLRRGDYAWQAHLDLHGMTVAEARPAVHSFLIESLRAGRRCVLIVHGRGHNSEDRTPVLKQRLTSWLSRGALGRAVLAFTTARPHDGGAGALYVLLRRDRNRRSFRVTSGTPS